MLVSDFHFDLPEELIAQHPPAERGSSRMLVLEWATGRLVDTHFADLPEWLRPGDLLVLNVSRVLPARLFATRGGLGKQVGSPQPTGLVEVLLTEQVEEAGSGSNPTSQSRDVGHPMVSNPTSQSRDVGHPMVWRVLVKPAKKVRVGETLHFAESLGGENAGILPLRQAQGQSDSS